MEKQKKLFGLRLMRVLAILGIVFMSAGLASLLIFKLPVNLPQYLVIAGLQLIYSIILIVAINRPSIKLYKVVIGFLILQVAHAGYALFAQSQNLVIASGLYDILAIWYLIEIKSYFENGHVDANDPKIKTANARFVVGTVALLIISPIYFITTLGGAAFNAGQQQANMMVEYHKEFQGKTAEEGIEYCKFQGQAAEVCMIILFSIYTSDTEGTVFDNSKKIDAKACENLQIAAFRYRCYALFERCDLIDDESMRRTCPDVVRNIKAGR